MPPQTQRPDGKTFVAAVITVAAVYVYFLIFAQFGFLKALAGAWEGAPGVMRSILAAMGLAGIGGSVLAARGFDAERGRRRLAVGLGLCVVASASAPLAKSIAGFSLVALLTGGGVGLATVALAGIMRLATGDGRLGLIIGLGTGLAYGFCNLPRVFDASAGAQAWIGVTAALVALAASQGLQPQFPPDSPGGGDYARAGVAAWVMLFLALVVLDSALFYFIQHTAALKEAMWIGTGPQLMNALMHGLAGVAAGWALDRRWLGRTAGLGAALLLGASVWIIGGDGGHASALTYIASVSVYSTVLVYYPMRSGRPAVAALVYAVAGWGGSALGIGLAEGRDQLPVALPAGAAVLLAISLMGRYFASRPQRAMNENKPE